ncbi:MAG: hypothetical protein H6Q69_2407 [Firmicutes bacterium]|nr:hypothetical protein [Bacillota bacterium]
MKITFINPNNEDMMDKYLPKILAEAVINMISKECNDVAVDNGNEYNVKHSA